MESRYRTIFETTGTATLIFEEDTTVTMVNDEFCRMSGYSRGEIEGRIRITDLISPEQLPRIREYHKHRVEDPGSAPASYDLVVKDSRGGVHDGVVTISLIPGTRQRVISFMDVTESKRAKEQMYRSEKMALLGQIVAGVAHEIDNPNNFVHFNLPILRRYIDELRPIVMAESEQDPGLRLAGLEAGAFFEDVTSLLDDMQHGCQRVTDIVGQLKDHLTAQKKEKRPEDPAALIGRAIALAGKKVRDRGCRLELDVPDGLSPVIMDAGGIEQVLINLLVNAAQARDKDDAFVRVRARTTGEGSLEMSVEDNGTGMAEGTLGRIFEPFFTTKDPDEGTGLGLWVCHGIVEEHGGTLAVDSTPGQGTVFTVRLPAA